MKFKKDNWIQSGIGTVADEINEKVLNPASSGCEKFIRPEDLEVGGFYVKSYRSPAEVGSGKRCYEGDILFARRSVSVSQFKRRSCILKFDAICSDEITVIRQNKNLYPEFLNLVLNTTQLWDYAIAHSVGSVSKRIKWEDLSKYQFLHPKEYEDQRKITDLLQSIETVLEQVDEQEKNINALLDTLIDGLVRKRPQFGNLLNSRNTRLVYFNQVLDCIESHDKEKKDIERFIGLENIETGTFQIVTWGNIADGTTFTKRFNSGDILFGKRRSYLKKVAVADFDGICSGDILVFRAKNDIILPELLPYYVSSKAFINHAVKTSAGSLSPRTKWKDLSEFEFPLPNLDVQSSVLEVLKQIQIVLKQISDQKSALRILKQNLLNEILS